MHFLPRHASLQFFRARLLRSSRAGLCTAPHPFTARIHMWPQPHLRVRPSADPSLGIPGFQVHLPTRTSPGALGTPQSQRALHHDRPPTPALPTPPSSRCLSCRQCPAPGPLSCLMLVTATGEQQSSAAFTLHTWTLRTKARSVPPPKLPGASIALRPQIRVKKQKQENPGSSQGPPGLGTCLSLHFPISILAFGQP